MSAHLAGPEVTRRLVRQPGLEPSSLQLGEGYEATANSHVAERDCAAGRRAVLSDDEVAHQALEGIRADHNVCLVRGTIGEADEKTARGGRRVHDGGVALAELGATRIEEATERVEEGSPVHTYAVNEAQRKARCEKSYRCRVIDACSGATRY